MFLRTTSRLSAAARAFPPSSRAVVELLQDLAPGSRLDGSLGQHATHGYVRGPRQEYPTVELREIEVLGLDGGERTVAPAPSARTRAPPESPAVITAPSRASRPK